MMIDGILSHKFSLSFATHTQISSTSTTHAHAHAHEEPVSKKKKKFFGQNQKTEEPIFNEIFDFKKRVHFSHCRIVIIQNVQRNVLKIIQSCQKTRIYDFCVFFRGERLLFYS